MPTDNAWHNKYAYAHSMRMTMMTGGLNYKIVGVVRPPLEKAGRGVFFASPPQKCKNLKSANQREEVLTSGFKMDHANLRSNNMVLGSILHEIQLWHNSSNDFLTS